MNWILRHCAYCGWGGFLYGEDDKQFECHNCDSTEYYIIPENQWSAVDLCTINSNELEDANYHSLTNMPQILYRILLRNKTSNEQCKNIIKQFFDELWKEL